MIKDSGNRTKFESGAVRDIQEGKGRCDLLPLSVIGYWLVDPIFEMIDLYRDEQIPDDMAQILNKFAEYHEVVHGPQFSEENRLNYRYSLVLEVAKHFEEGAKKYGDRNWEKGIPCDRYIDSAVRHYCKWRAGWTDEPHDRAFIWNILCCEWTRQRYGWDLERLGKSDDSAIKEFINKIGNGDFGESESRKYFRIGEQFSKDILDSIERVDEAFNKAFSESPLTIRVKKEVIRNEDVLAQIKEQETADLKAACDVVELHNKCLTSPTEFCYAKACKECEYHQDPEVVHKAVNQLLDHTKKSLENTEVK